MWNDATVVKYINSLCARYGIRKRLYHTDEFFPMVHALIGFLENTVGPFSFRVKRDLAELKKNFNPMIDGLNNPFYAEAGPLSRHMGA